MYRAAESIIKLGIITVLMGTYIYFNRNKEGEEIYKDT